MQTWTQESKIKDIHVYYVSKAALVIAVAADA